MEKRNDGKREAVEADEVEDTERDSRAQMTDSGELLADDDNLQPRDANAGTVPRINTDHL